MDGVFGFAESDPIDVLIRNNHLKYTIRIYLGQKAPVMVQY